MTPKAPPAPVWAAQAARLPGGRLHLHQGPIDIIARLWGDPVAVAAAEARAVDRFSSILNELMAEISALRAEEAPVHGDIARTMALAVAPFRPAFVTPMAAVAGAVAEAVLRAAAGPGITRAYVNNGGDIALFLSPETALTCAIANRPGMPDRITIRAADPVRGIATSGWRGRSFSLGIADSVTVLAASAAMADAAATMIANAVDLPGHPGIQRRPAQEIQPDSDLGARQVTVAVPRFTPGEQDEALALGLAAAEDFRQRGLVEAAALFLQGQIRTTGGFPMLPQERAHV